MKRKHLGVVLALAVSLIGGPTVVSAAQLPTPVLSTNANVKLAPAKAVKKTTANLNLRKSASTSSASLALVPKNTALSILKVSGTWHQVTYKSKTGWVSGNYLVKTSTGKAKVYNYTKGYTTLRSKASNSSSAILSVHRRTKVEVIGKSGSWVKVKASGKTGFVPSSALTRLNPSAVNRWVNGKQKAFVKASASEQNPHHIAIQHQGRMASDFRLVAAGQDCRGCWMGAVEVPFHQGRSAVRTRHQAHIPQTAHTTASGAELQQPQMDHQCGQCSHRRGHKLQEPRCHPGRRKGAPGPLRRRLGKRQDQQGRRMGERTYLSEAEYNKPVEVQYRWANGNVNLRAGNSTAYEVLDVVPAGERVTFLESKDGWARVISSKGVGWMSEALLSKTMIATLQPDTLAVMNAVRARYSSLISSIGGIRPGSVGHSAGKAADIMIRDYRNPINVAKGDEMAQFLINNRSSLGISYLIWQDKIWLGPARGWEEYSKSGKYGQQFSGNWNDTTLHMDHIHAETYGDSGSRAPLSK